MFNTFELIDISIPISTRTACFPGDTPFSKDEIVELGKTGTYNLTKLTMSPHVGTHADAPSHISGTLTDGNSNVGSLPLSPFIGPTLVIDLSPLNSEITLDACRSTLETVKPLPERILFKTAKSLRHEVFEKEYAYFSVDLISFLADKNVKLVGIDSPSVDHISSKTLPAHHVLITSKMYWLENLDLSKVSSGQYFLIAPPLKFMELEASPVRAVLLKSTE